MKYLKSFSSYPINESMGISEEAQRLCRTIEPLVKNLEKSEIVTILESDYKELKNLNIRKIVIKRVKRGWTLGSFNEGESSFNERLGHTIIFELEHNSTRSTILHECLHAVQYIKKRGKLSSSMAPFSKNIKSLSGKNSGDVGGALELLAEILYYCSDEEVSAHLHSLYEDILSLSSDEIRKVTDFGFNISKFNDVYMIYDGLKNIDMSVLFELIPDEILNKLVTDLRVFDIIKKSHKGNLISTVFRVVWKIAFSKKKVSHVSEGDRKKFIKKITFIRDYMCNKFLRSAAKIGSKIKIDNDLITKSNFPKKKTFDQQDGKITHFRQKYGDW